MCAMRRGLRKYQVMRWIDALEHGYGMDRTGQLQYPSLSNLAMHMLDAEVAKTQIRNKFGFDAVEPTFSKEAYSYFKGRINSTLQKVKRQTITTEEVKKSPDNHLSIVRGYDKQFQTVNVYYLTKEGYKEMERDGKGVKHAMETEYPDRDIKEIDTVVLPLYTDRRGWHTTTLRVPKPYHMEHEHIWKG